MILVHKTRTILFSVPQRFKPEVNITTLNGKSRIEGVWDGRKSYFYCSSGSPISVKQWDRLFGELGLNKKDSYFLTKEDWRKQLQRILYNDFQGRWVEENPFLLRQWWNTLSDSKSR